MTRRIALAAIAAVGLAAACTVGPRYRVPSAPVPAASRYKEAGGAGPWRVASPSDAMLRGAWWKVFREPELDALEARIDLHNQNIAQAFASFLAARAQIRAARAQYFPTVTTSPSIALRRGAGGFGGAAGGFGGAAGGFGGAPGGLGGAPASSPGQPAGAGGSARAGGGRVTSYALPLEVSWAPDLFGRVRNAVRQSQYNAQVSAADLESQRLLEHATLAQTYFELRGQDALVDLLEATVASDAELLALARARYETGIDSLVAVVQAEQALQAARVQATNAGVLRAQYEHAIATLIGTAATTFSLPRRALRATPPAIPTGAPSRLLERRPDIASAERRMAAANAAIGIGYAAYYPDITLSGLVGLAGSSLTSWPGLVWAVGTTLSQTLFDAGLRRAAIDQAIAAYHAAVAGYRQTVLAAFQQVEDGLAETRILAQEIDQQRRSVALAAQALDLERTRYELGIDPYINVMQEQVLLLEARQTLVTLQVRRMTSAVLLVESLGGGWDRSELPTPAQVSNPPPASARKIWR